MGCSSDSSIERRKDINATKPEIDLHSSESYSDNSENRKEEKYIGKVIIGKGNFGTVYRAESTISHKDCAVKVIDYIPQNRDLAYKEFNVLSECHHPNIISFKESFKKKTDTNKTFNIVTEFVNGGTLKEKLDEQKNKNYEEITLIIWIIQVCLGLSYLHNKKIIHRDIKPENIFLTEKGLIKIGDLGLAKQYESKEDLKRQNTKAGTLCFMSPEMKNTQIYNDKTDIYSLGKTFLLFIGCKNNYSEEFKKLINILTEDNQDKRPTADEILKMPIIQNGMKVFLRKYNYRNSLAYIIMENLQKNNILKNEKDGNNDDFIKIIKKERKELTKEKELSDKYKEGKDLDILMCIIKYKISSLKI